METIQAALLQLDPEKDEHWTTDGLPRVDIVSGLLGRSVTRKEITEAGPNVTRTTAGEEEAMDPGTVTTEDEEDGEDQPYDDSQEPTEEQAKPAKQPRESFTPGKHTIRVMPEPPAEAAAMIEAQDEVLAMPFDVVAQDPDLIDRACVELDRQAGVLARRRTAIDERLHELGARSELLQRARSQIVRGTGESEHQKQLNAYLESNRRSREAKALRARAFIEAQTTPADVAKELDIRSPLDRALAQRRPQHGAPRRLTPAAGA